MATLNMPPKGAATDSPASSDDFEPRGQVKTVRHRFRLQVDRQTKATFRDRAAAGKRGKQIKTNYPKVQVIVYDAETEVRLAIIP
jgi:hypothetical protein